MAFWREFVLDKMEQRLDEWLEEQREFKLITTKEMKENFMRMLKEEIGRVNMG